MAQSCSSLQQSDCYGNVPGCHWQPITNSCSNLSNSICTTKTGCTLNSGRCSGPWSWCTSLTSETSCLVSGVCEWGDPYCSGSYVAGGVCTGNPTCSTTFGNWSACSVSCGPGTQKRVNGCGEEEVRDCKIKDCPGNEPGSSLSCKYCVSANTSSAECRTRSTCVPELNECNTRDDCGYIPAGATCNSLTVGKIDNSKICVYELINNKYSWVPVANTSNGVYDASLALYHASELEELKTLIENCRKLNSLQERQNCLTHIGVNNITTINNILNNELQCASFLLNMVYESFGPQWAIQLTGGPVANSAQMLNVCTGQMSNGNCQTTQTINNVPMQVRVCAAGSANCNPQQGDMLVMVRTSDPCSQNLGVECTQIGHIAMVIDGNGTRVEVVNSNYSETGGITFDTIRICNNNPNCTFQSYFLKVTP